MIKSLFIKWYRFCIIKNLENKVRQLIIPFWKRGFIQSNFIHIFNNTSYIKSLFIYLIILQEFGEKDNIAKTIETLNRLKIISITDAMIDAKKVEYGNLLPNFHPYIHCFKDSNYVFKHIRCQYPIKISRAITICMQNETEYIWNLLQKIKDNCQNTDLVFGGIFLSFIEKWQPSTFSLLLQCIDSEFLNKLLPYIYQKNKIQSSNVSQIDVLKDSLSLVPVENDIKLKWFSNLDTLGGQNNDTFYKYKTYYESIISIPFNVYHHLEIPSQTFYDTLNQTLSLYSPKIKKISEIHHTFPQLGLYGILDSWDTCLQYIRSYAFTRLRSLKKKEINRIKKRIKGDIYSCDPILTLGDDTEIIHQTQKLAIDLRNWIKMYVEKSKKTMDSVIFGMNSPKQFVMNEVVNWLNQTNHGLVLGLCGPPGVGKTTFVRNAIAPCFRDDNGKPRPVITVSLGGKVSGSSLKGHGFTYVGSKFGQIVQGLIQSKCMNPIIYFDELDKVSQTPHGGEVNSILMQLTDFSQNKDFEDEYFHDIKFDVSRCIFIFSYNDREKIDPILLNRIQEIQLNPIIFQEKLHILHNYTVPKLLKMYKLPLQLKSKYTKELLTNIVLLYTNEPGVRNAEAILNYIISKQCYLYSTQQIRFDTIHADTIIKDYLNLHTELICQLPWNKSGVGKILGLYATTIGTGGILPIESQLNDKDEMSGNVSQVMKESQMVARRVVNAKDLLLYIHYNQAGIPKDGPSAGLAVTLLYWSHMNQVKIPHNLAVTGEITVRGDVDPVGGIIVKFFSAIRWGVKTIIAPKQNQNEWESYLQSIERQIRREIESKVKIYWVSTWKEATRVVLRK